MVSAQSARAPSLPYKCDRTRGLDGASNTLTSVSFLTSAILVVVGSPLHQVLTEYLRRNVYEVPSKAEAICPLVAAGLSRLIAWAVQRSITSAALPRRQRRSLTRAGGPRTSTSSGGAGMISGYHRIIEQELPRSWADERHRRKCYE